MPSDHDSGDDGRRRPPERPQEPGRGDGSERDIDPGLRPPKRPVGQRFGAPPGAPSDEEPHYPEESAFASGRGSGGRPPQPPEGDRFEDLWSDESPPVDESRRPPRRDSDPSADLYAPEPQDDYDDYLAPPPSGPPPRQRSRILPVFIALLALAGFAALLWYAYSWGVGGSDSANIPVVSAETSPAKVAPEEPGGMEIPNQDKQVLNQGEGGDGAAVEQLLPPPEEPSPPQVSEEPPPQLPDEQEAVTGQGTGTAGATSEPPPAPESAPEPAQAPDQSAVQTAEPTAGQTAEQSAEQSAGQNAGQPASEAQQAQAEAPPPPQLSEPPAGAYVMQLASVRSAETARSEWARMQSEHELLLGDMPLFIQQVELEGRGTYFRIQTGPFPSRSTAQDLCAQLKTAGQDCLVTQR